MTPARPPDQLRPADAGDEMRPEPFRPPHDEECPVCNPNRGDHVVLMVVMMALLVGSVLLIRAIVAGGIP